MRRSPGSHYVSGCHASNVIALSLITELKQTIAVTSHRRDKTGRLASGGGRTRVPYYCALLASSWICFCCFGEWVL